SHRWLEACRRHESWWPRSRVPGANPPSACQHLHPGRVQSRSDSRPFHQRIDQVIRNSIPIDMLMDFLLMVAVVATGNDIVSPPTITVPEPSSLIVAAGTASLALL